MSILVPPIGWKVSGGGGYTYTITAGTSGSFIRGFWTALSIGSIHNQPIPGFSISGTYTSSSGAGSLSVRVAGDARSLLSAHTVWVNGVQIGPATIYNWELFSGETLWQSANGATPIYFVNGNTYGIEIRPP